MKAQFCLVLGLSFWVALGSGALFAADKFGQDVPNELDALVDRARQQRLPYLDAYDPESSIEALEQAVATKPDYYRAWFNLGLAYFEGDRYEESAKSFDRALDVRKELGIRDNTILNTAGWAAMKSGDYARAEALLKLAETATAGDGTFTEKAVVANLGELYFLTQEFPEAKIYLERYRDEFDGDSVEYFLNIIAETEKARQVK